MDWGETSERTVTIRSFAGMSPLLGPGAYVDDTALVVGDVTLGRDTSIWPMAVARGDIQRITLGERSNIQDGCVLHVTHGSRFNPGGHPLVVGDEVTVGHQVVLHGCRIADRCLIGMGSVVMDGVVIGPQVILAAGCLVPPGKALESGYLWVGRPARRSRSLTDEELAYLEYAAAHYVTLKDRHLAASKT